MKSKDKIRQPAVSGMFYSGNKETLQKEVAVFLESSILEPIVNKVYGIVAPHAGYMYSGGVAARAYRQLVDRQFDTVVVISPSHRQYFEEISIFDGTAYQTPLGTIPVDKELAGELAEQDDNIICSGLGHEVDEHALEVQLPFLQHVLADFKLLPVVMGNQDDHNVEILGRALSEVLKDRNALIVASSDLSHYHNYERASVLDRLVVEHIERFDEENLGGDLGEGRCEMCGGGPVRATMKACRLLGAKKSKVLLYRNSGDVSGDRGQVVGYLSAMFYE